MSLKQDYAEFKEIVKFFARDARSPLRKWWKPFTCVSTFLAGSAAAALSAPFVLIPVGRFGDSANPCGHLV